MPISFNQLNSLKSVFEQIFFDLLIIPQVTIRKWQQKFQFSRTLTTKFKPKLLHSTKATLQLSTVGWLHSQQPMKISLNTFKMQRWCKSWQWKYALAYCVPQLFKWTHHVSQQIVTKRPSRRTRISPEFNRQGQHKCVRQFILFQFRINTARSASYFITPPG